MARRKVKIDNFEKGPWCFLSNFFPSTIVYKGITYPTVEHAYQAAKTMDKGKRFAISEAKSPAMAKKMGRAIKSLRKNWDRKKILVMEELLRLKFSNYHMAKMLLSTSYAELIEGNWWGDTFWGVCKDRGKNMLGRLLMETRETIREGGKIR